MMLAALILFCVVAGAPVVVFALALTITFIAAVAVHLLQKCGVR